MKIALSLAVLLAFSLITYGATPLIGPESDFTKELKRETNAVGWRTKLGVSATIDVRNYGAVGDGSTDDTLALQAGINAAAQTGGSQTDATTFSRTLYFPKGNYRITAPLTVPQCAGFSMVGEGGRNESSTIQWDGVDGTINTNFMVDFDSIVGLRVENMRFVGQADITDTNSARILNGLVTGRSGATNWYNSYNDWENVTVQRFAGVGVQIGRYSGYSGGVYPTDYGQTDNSEFTGLDIHDCRVGIVINTINFLQSTFHHLKVDSYGGNPVDGGGTPVEDPNAAPIMFRCRNAVQVLYGSFVGDDIATYAPFDDGGTASQYAFYVYDGTLTILSGYSEIYNLAYFANGANDTGGTNIKLPNSIANFDMYSGAAGGVYDAAKYPIYYDNEKVPLTLTACDDVWVMESARSAGVTAIGCRVQGTAVAFTSLDPPTHSRKSSEFNCNTMYFDSVARWEPTSRVGRSGNLFSAEAQEFFVLPGFRQIMPAPGVVPYWQDMRESTNVDAHILMFDTSGLTIGWIPGSALLHPAYERNALLDHPVFMAQAGGRVSIASTNTPFFSMYRGTGMTTNRLGFIGFTNPSDDIMRIWADSQGIQYHAGTNYGHLWMSGSDILGGLSDTGNLVIKGSVNATNGYAVGSVSGISQTNSWSDAGGTNWTMKISGGIVTELSHTP